MQHHQLHQGSQRLGRGACQPISRRLSVLSRRVSLAGAPEAHPLPQAAADPGGRPVGLLPGGELRHVPGYRQDHHVCRLQGPADLEYHGLSVV